MASRTAAARKPRNNQPPAASLVPPPVLAPPSKLVRLDLGCGLNPREGFEGVDNLADAAHKVDLLRFPWPWADDSVDELHTSHLIEHIDSRAVEARDLVDPNPQTIERWVGVDMLCAFFDECWRILKHDGTLKVICPALRTNRAFQDPTHRRYIAAETFAYFSRDWREAVGLKHYRIRANFSGGCNHTLPTTETARSDEAQRQRYNELWNVTYDWICDMVAIKREPPAALTAVGPAEVIPPPAAPPKKKRKAKP